MGEVSQQSRRPCACTAIHEPRRVVLTGGPGAGKTAVLELCKRLFCRHVVILPESASVLFAGGFPRGGSVLERAATQRAIYHVQRELEAFADAQEAEAVILCDRGTVDGAAYWPGPGTLFAAVGSSHAAELARYAAVIHLRTPDARDYPRDNPVRIESAEQAASIDEAIARTWRAHPSYSMVASQPSFLSKAEAAIALIRAQLPACCA